LIKCCFMVCLETSKISKCQFFKIKFWPKTYQNMTARNIISFLVCFLDWSVKLKLMAKQKNNSNLTLNIRNQAEKVVVQRPKHPNPWYTRIKKTVSMNCVQKWQHQIKQLFKIFNKCYRWINLAQASRWKINFIENKSYMIASRFFNCLQFNYQTNKRIMTI
jgi:hypothetical protein